MSGLTIGELPHTSDTLLSDLVEIERSGKPLCATLEHTVSNVSYALAQKSGYKGSEAEFINKWANGLSPQDVTSQIEEKNPQPVSSEAVYYYVDQNLKLLDRKIPTKVSELTNDAAFLSQNEITENVALGNSHPVSSNAVAIEVAQKGDNVLERSKEFTRSYAQPRYVGSALTSLFEYAGIHYNADTGYYELNGVNDLTEQQAASIFIAGPLQEWVKFQYGGAINKALPTDVRTNLCYPSWFNGTTLTEKYRGNVSLEVALIISSRERHDPEANSNYYTILKDTRMSYCFDSCTKLRKVIGVLDCSYVTSGSDGWYCPMLEEVYLRNIVGDYNMKGSPRLSKKSVLYMIRYAAPTKVITVTYHSDVYNMAMADADIQAALSAQPLVALASA